MIFRAAESKTLAKGSNFIGSAGYKRLFAGRKPSYKGFFLSGYCAGREKFDPLARVFCGGAIIGHMATGVPAVTADACGGEGACGGDSYYESKKRRVVPPVGCGKRVTALTSP